MQDFRTRLVCPECGESDNSELAEPPIFGGERIADDSVVRRCLDCEHIWWVDWSPRPVVAIR